MKARNYLRWLNWTLVLLLLVLALWMGYETWKGAPAHYGLHRNTPQETIVIRPGRAVIAYYLFLITLSLLPAVWFWRSAAAARRRIPIAAGLISLAASAFIGGFAYETLQSEIRLTLTGVGYRAGGMRVAMPWTDIQAIAVRTHSRTQWMELLGVRSAVRIDLGPFALRDKQMLVGELPRIARLNTVPRKLPDGWVWRRATGIQIPE